MTNDELFNRLQMLVVGQSKQYLDGRLSDVENALYTIIGQLNYIQGKLDGGVTNDNIRS